MQKIILTLIILSLFANSSLALLELKAPEELKVFACSPAEFDLELTNLGAPNSFDLSLSGKFSKYASLEPEKIFLNNGETKKILLKIATPCDIASGKLILKSDNSSWPLKIKVLVPNNIEIIPKVWEEKTFPCGKANYSFYIRNPINFLENYSFEIKGLAVLTDLEDLELKPGEGKEINFTLQPTECDVFGTFYLKFLAKTKFSKIVASFDLKLEIESKGIAGIDVPNLIFGLGKFKIKNLGSEEETFKLSLEPAWLKADKEILALKPFQSEEIGLIAENLTYGLNKVKIIALAQSTGNAYTKETQILILNLGFFKKYWLHFLLAFIAIALIAFSYFSIKNLVKSKTFLEAQKFVKKRSKLAIGFVFGFAFLVLLLLGIFIPSIRFYIFILISLTLVLFIAFIPTKSIKQREKEKLKLEVEKELKNEYRLIPREELIKKEKDYLTFIFLALFASVFVLAFVFRNFLIANLKFFALALPLPLLLITFYFILKQKVSIAKWHWLVQGEQASLATNWSSGLAKLHFTLTKTVENFWLKAVKHGKAFPLPNDLVYQYFSLDSSLAPELFEKIALEFKIKRSWLNNCRADYKDVQIYIYENEKWKPLKTQLVASSISHYFFAAFPHKLGLFAIVVKNAKLIKRINLFDFLILALFIGVAVVGGFFLFSKPLGIPDQILIKNGVAYLDLSPYFYDPDRDYLIFEASRTENLNIEFDGAIAKITPKENWVGKESIVFSASDGQGGIAYSNALEIAVVEPFDFLILLKFKKYFAIGLITIGAILFLVKVLFILNKIFKNFKLKKL